MESLIVRNCDEYRVSQKENGALVLKVDGLGEIELTLEQVESFFVNVTDLKAVNTDNFNDFYNIKSKEKTLNVVQMGEVDLTIDTDQNEVFNIPIHEFDNTPVKPFRLNSFLKSTKDNGNNLTELELEIILDVLNETNLDVYKLTLEIDSINSQLTLIVDSDPDENTDDFITISRDLSKAEEVKVFLNSLGIRYEVIEC